MISRVASEELRIKRYLYEIIRASRTHIHTYARGREEKGKADYRRHAVTPPFVPFYPQRPTTSRDIAIDGNPPGREEDAEMHRKIPGYIECLRRSYLIVRD